GGSHLRRARAARPRVRREERCGASRLRERPARSDARCAARPCGARVACGRGEPTAPAAGGGRALDRRYEERRPMMFRAMYRVLFVLAALAPMGCATEGGLSRSAIDAYGDPAGIDW